MEMETTRWCLSLRVVHWGWDGRCPCFAICPAGIVFHCRPAQRWVWAIFQNFVFSYFFLRLCLLLFCKARHHKANFHWAQLSAFVVLIDALWTLWDSLFGPFWYFLVVLVLCFYVGICLQFCICHVMNLSLGGHAHNTSWTYFWLNSHGLVAWLAGQNNCRATWWRQCSAEIKGRRQEEWRRIKLLPHCNWQTYEYILYIYKISTSQKKRIKKIWKKSPLMIREWYVFAARGQEGRRSGGG